MLHIFPAHVSAYDTARRVCASGVMRSSTRSPGSKESGGLTRVMTQSNSEVKAVCTTMPISVMQLTMSVMSDSMFSMKMRVGTAVDTYIRRL